MNKINPRILVGIVVVTVVVFGAGGFYILNSNSDTAEVPTATPSMNTGQTAVTEIEASPTSAAKSTEEQLLYLIEEEKLAHDVYTVMYQKYGANIFGNILQSESTHQSQVLTLLQVRNIADPRSPEVGVFKNRDLQAFYDQLIEQGSKTETEAYNAGVTIEEKDIADISTQLATTTDQDVIDTLELLRKGSENHLRAFNQQL